MANDKTMARQSADFAIREYDAVADLLNMASIDCPEILVANAQKILDSTEKISLAMRRVRESLNNGTRSR